jgi:hypothetical protein
MYYPKNQIQSGLFSNGELFNPQTNQAYYGYYFKTSDNKVFTGKEPNDGSNVQLIPSPTPPPPTNFEIGQEDLRFYPENFTYSILTKVNPNQQIFIPTSHYPVLSPIDIQNGEFTRYFCKKYNENVYIEVNSNTYAASIQSNLYFGIQFLWVISGNEEQVKLTNAKQVDLVERTLNIKGLAEYLRFNYLQFYQA